MGLLLLLRSRHGHGIENSLAWAESLFAQEGISIPDGKIWLQTLPRVLGYVFNPVSFWVCTDEHQAVRAILAEVNNTFGERHCYLLQKRWWQDLFRRNTD